MTRIVLKDVKHINLNSFLLSTYVFTCFFWSFKFYQCLCWSLCLSLSLTLSQLFIYLSVCISLSFSLSLSQSFSVQSHVSFYSLFIFCFSRRMMKRTVRYVCEDMCVFAFVWMWCMCVCVSICSVSSLILEFNELKFTSPPVLLPYVFVCATFASLI